MFAAGLVVGLIAGAVLGVQWADEAARYGDHSGRVDRLIHRAKRGDQPPRGLESDVERTQEIFPPAEGMGGEWWPGEYL
jgi:hypothetical protein